MSFTHKPGTIGAITTLALLLAGCGSKVQFGTSTGSTPAALQIMGRMHGGQQPVTGASVYLYATGTSGYGSASTSLLDPTKPGVQPDDSVLTGSDGSFSISGDYTCPDGAYVYLVGRGGNPGNADGASNSGIGLMSLLGSCAFVQANAGTLSVNVNEITTVASVWALAPFMTSATAIGTSSGNTQGLANAIKTFYNLADIQTGASPGVGQPITGNTFAGLPTGLTVPAQEIYALANVLAYCVNSDPATSTNCSTLYTDATPPGGSAPTDTIAAALDIAQNPSSNASALLNLGSSSGAFPSTTTAVNDWTIVLTYTGGGIASPLNLAIDAAGNCWAANDSSSTSGLTIIGASGSRLSGTAGYTSGGLAQPFAIAVDASSTPMGWIADIAAGKGGVSAVNIDGTALTGSPFTGGGITTGSGPHGIAIDNSGNIWTANQTGGTNGVDEFGSDGSHKLGPIDVGGLTSTNAPFGLTIDSSNTIWVAGRGASNVVRLNNDGTAYAGSPLATSAGNGISAPFNIAIDAGGAGWTSNFGNNSLTKVVWGATPTGTKYTATQLAQPAWVSVDGLNNVWVANYSSASASAACISEFSNAGTLLTPVCLAKGLLLNAHGLAVDGSGNLWIGGTNALGEMVGVAGPVVTPLVTATSTSKLGQRP